MELPNAITIESGTYLSDLVVSNPNLELVGVIDDPAESDQLVEVSGSRLVLMDLGPATYESGIQATLRLRRNNPRLGVVIVSELCDLATMSQLPTEYTAEFRSGWSYLFKSEQVDPWLFARAIDLSFHRHTLLDAAVMAQLARTYPDEAQSMRGGARRFVDLAGQGLSNREIAREAMVKNTTVEMMFYSGFVDLCRAWKERARSL